MVYRIGNSVVRRNMYQMDPGIWHQYQDMLTSPTVSGSMWLDQKNIGKWIQDNLSVILDRVHDVRAEGMDMRCQVWKIPLNLNAIDTFT